MSLNYSTKLILDILQIEETLSDLFWEVYKQELKLSSIEQCDGMTIIRMPHEFILWKSTMLSNVECGPIVQYIDINEVDWESVLLMVLMQRDNG